MYLSALSTLRKVIMMNNIYAVFDSCSGLFGDPLIAANDAAAKRIFEFTLSQPSIPKFVRDDSVLYGIGYYDNTTGCFTADRPPYVVCRGSSVTVPDSCETDDSEVNICAE